MAHFQPLLLSTVFNSTFAIPWDNGTRFYISKGEADMDANEMKSMLVAYTACTAALLSNPRPLFLSLATDKPSVKTFSIQNTATVLPSNHACWLVPQASPPEKENKDMLFPYGMIFQ